MPWDHCDVEFILDDEPCPRCGVAKGAWTVQVEQTRTLRIGRKKPRARWSVQRSPARAEVLLLVDTSGLPNGTTRTLRIFEHDADGQHDLVAEVEGAVRDGTLQAPWTTVWAADDDDDDDRGPARYELAEADVSPEFFFEVELPQGRVTSGTGDDELLRLTTDLDLRLVDAAGAPRARVPVEVVLFDGTKIGAQSDDAGVVHVGGLLAGRAAVQILEAPAPPPPCVFVGTWCAPMPDLEEAAPGGRAPEARGPQARWSAPTAGVGEEVTLIVDHPELPDGTTVPLRIYEHDRDGAHDLVAEVLGRVLAHRLEANWTTVWVGDDDDDDDDDVAVPRYELDASSNSPEYFFEVDLPAGRVGSGFHETELLVVTETLSLVLLDGAGNPRPDVPVEVRLPGRRRAEARSDANGVVQVPAVRARRAAIQIHEAPAPPTPVVWVPMREPTGRDP